MRRRAAGGKVSTTTLRSRVPAGVAAMALATAGALALAAGLPPEQRAGGVAYVTGGVGEEEAAAFKGALADYPLAIEVVRNNAGRDEYTAGATVRVTRDDGFVVLDTPAEGPFVLVRLPPGRYHVEATLQGRVLSKDVRVPEHGSTHAVLTFAGGG